MFQLCDRKPINGRSGHLRPPPAEFQNFVHFSKHTFSVVYFFDEIHNSKHIFILSLFTMHHKHPHFIFTSVKTTVVWHLSILLDPPRHQWWLALFLGGDQWVSESSIGRLCQVWTRAFFHMCIVRFLPEFFSRRSKSSCDSANEFANSVSAGWQSWLLGGYPFSYLSSDWWNSQYIYFTHGFFPPPG